MSFLLSHHKNNIVACIGIAWWKRQRISQFFSNFIDHPVLFFWSEKKALNYALQKQGAIAVWATRFSPWLKKEADKNHISLIFIEDGFIRSQGLGSGFQLPASIICDTRGHYFDPHHLSDLEYNLQNFEVSSSLRERTQRLIKRLVVEKVSKYGDMSNTQKVNITSRKNKKQEKVILVPGQVSDDLSVLLGGNKMTNLDLLKKVRLDQPNAWIIYRPHPDVTAGHRQGVVSEEDILKYADDIEYHKNMANLLDDVDAVHVLTSLTGFEAILRNIPVTVWGQPFYAGWGLTRDMGGIFPRRKRKLDRLDFVAIVLIIYPLYLDPLTGFLCTVETLLDRLQNKNIWRPGWIMKIRYFQGYLMNFLRLI